MRQRQVPGAPAELDRRREIGPVGAGNPAEIVERRQLDQSGQGNVAVLSRGIWERRFGADPEIVGSTVYLDGEFRPRAVFGDFTVEGARRVNGYVNAAGLIIREEETA